MEHQPLSLMGGLFPGMWFSRRFRLSPAADLQLFPLQDVRLPGVRRGNHGGLDGGRLQPEHHLSVLWKSILALPQRGDQRPARTRQVDQKGGRYERKVFLGFFIGF